MQDEAHDLAPVDAGPLDAGRLDAGRGDGGRPDEAGAPAEPGPSAVGSDVSPGGGDTADTGRDADLVTLEGLESELEELDAELARVEEADAAAGIDPAGPPPR